MLASARKVLRIHTEDSDGPALDLNKQGSERKRGPRMGSYKHSGLPDVALCVILCACVGVGTGVRKEARGQHQVLFLRDPLPFV